MRSLGQFYTFFFYNKISQVQKNIFLNQHRLKFDLVLYTYVFIYLKATIKKIHFYLSVINLVKPTFTS